MLLKNKRVFIVEDNLANRKITQMLLEKHGAQVAFERWGRETCRLLEGFAPVDIILLDLMFPDNITGYDVYDAIRALPKFAEVPIVAVSASDSAVAIPMTRDKGFAGFIAKPIDFFMFPQQVAAMIRGEHIWTAV
jgi:CheY-like chemotaxis protein